jgi:rhodanese-related sulfurtransferase
MAALLRLSLIVVLACVAAACSSNVRREYGGGGTGQQVMLLNDRPAVEISIWEGGQVFDLRDYDAWAQGHIPGAVRATVEDIARGRHLPVNRKTPLVFMGDGPLDTRPERAAQSALERGFSNVQLYAGGWRDWIGAHPIRD